jgi:hypothetical protein
VNPGLHPGKFSAPSTGSGQAVRDLIKPHNVPSTSPGFLYAALERSAYAAFFTESRIRLIESMQRQRACSCGAGSSFELLFSVNGWRSLDRPNASASDKTE